MTRDVLDAVLASLVSGLPVEMAFDDDANVELGIVADTIDADLLDDGTLVSEHHGAFNGLPWSVRLVRPGQPMCSCGLPFAEFAGPEGRGLICVRCDDQEDT